MVFEHSLPNKFHAFSCRLDATINHLSSTMPNLMSIARWRTLCFSQGTRGSKLPETLSNFACLEVKDLQVALKRIHYTCMAGFQFGSVPDSIRSAASL